MCNERSTSSHPLITFLYNGDELCERAPKSRLPRHSQASKRSCTPRSIRVSHLTRHTLLQKTYHNRDNLSEEVCRGNVSQVKTAAKPIFAFFLLGNNPQTQRVRSCTLESHVPNHSSHFKELRQVSCAAILLFR